MRKEGNDPQTTFQGISKMLKKIAVAIAGATTMGMSGFAASETVPSPIGDFDVSMTATFASDYIWRGQSQTGGEAAIQGSLDIAHESGLYAGMWGSNVDETLFANTDGSDGANIEVDYYIGYGNTIGDILSYDLSWNTYTYPGASNLNVDEVIGSLGAYGLTVGVKYAYDPDSKVYSFVSYDYELPYEVGLNVAYGYTDYKDAVDGDLGREHYQDWSLTLSKTFATLDFAVMYSDTDMSKAECTWMAGEDDLCDSKITVSVSKSF